MPPSLASLTPEHQVWSGSADLVLSFTRDPREVWVIEVGVDAEQDLDLVEFNHGYVKTQMPRDESLRLHDLDEWDFHERQVRKVLIHDLSRAT